MKYILSLMLFTSCACTTKMPIQLVKHDVKDPNIHIPLNVKYIELNSEIDSASTTQFITDMSIDSHTKAIIIHINTPGGSVINGEIIGDYIRRSKVPTYCLVDGYAYSMGFYILQTCTHRIMTNSATIMIHGPRYDYVSGNKNELYRKARELTKIEIHLVKAYCKRLSMNTKQVLKMIDGRDIFLSAAKAKHLHAIDKVVVDHTIGIKYILSRIK